MESLPPLIDLHEDIATYYTSLGGGEKLDSFDVDAENRQTDLPKLRRANARIVFAAIFPAISSTFFYEARSKTKWRPYFLFRDSMAVVWEQLRVYYWLSKTYRVEVVVDSHSARKFVEASEWRLGFLLHIEGADPLADVWDLEVLYRLGVRSIGLTWNHDNKYAASCMTKKDYGLTGEGEELVKYANRLGVIVDLAHASGRAVVEAAQVSRKPIIVSHTGIASVNNTPRNIGEEALEAVYENRGVVGIGFVPRFIKKKGKPSIGELAEHFIRVYESYGSEIIAIGTDYHGMMGYEGPEGLERIDGISLLYKELLKRGMSEKDLENMAYRNALRVIEANLS